MKEDVFGAEEVARALQRLVTETGEVDPRLVEFCRETDQRTTQGEPQQEHDIPACQAALHEEEPQLLARAQIAAAVAQAEQLGRLEGERLSRLLDEELDGVLPELHEQPFPKSRNNLTF